MPFGEVSDPTKSAPLPAGSQDSSQRARSWPVCRRGQAENRAAHVTLSRLSECPGAERNAAQRNGVECRGAETGESGSNFLLQRSGHVDAVFELACPPVPALPDPIGQARSAQTILPCLDRWRTVGTERNGAARSRVSRRVSCRVRGRRVRGRTGRAGKQSGMKRSGAGSICRVRV